MKNKLPLDSLADRHPGLTKAIGDGYLEAAAVCLSRHHQTPAELVVNCQGSTSECSAEWVPPDQRTERAWANEIDATEAGAYAISLAAIEMAQGLVAVRRAEKHTGADYYIAPIGSDPEDLEECLRLEVSGTDKGDRTTIKQRLKTKIEQAAAGASNLPAIASVVGFRELAVSIATVEEAS
jgi:hypothetical protein